jgi:hypothetical protein
METFAKIAGWTILAAVVAKLFLSPAFGTNISSILGEWSNVVSSITGGGGATPTAQQQTFSPFNGGRAA